MNMRLQTKSAVLRRLFTAGFLLTAIISLSGCSESPATETLQADDLDKYSYLSKAIEETSANAEPAQNAQASSTPASSRSATPTQPTPSVAGATNTAGNPREENTHPDPTPPSTNIPEEATSTSTELEFIKKYDGATIKTSEGDITLHFYNDDAPKTVNNFFKLAADDFYDGTKFHRVIKGFMIQGGDPNSKDDNWTDDGQGGPGYAFDDEINSHKLIEGSVAMANSGPNTNGSQFFIVTAKSAPLLDGKYTNFGEVTDGLDVVHKIEDVETNENDHPTKDVTIKSVKFIKKKG